MDDPSRDDNAEAGKEFARLAEKRSRGTFREFLGFMGHSKKWWLLPILFFVALIWILILVGGTSAAPFIYTLF
jgi:hypothetical protein